MTLAMRVFLLHAIGAPVAGATLYLIVLGGAAHAAWGLPIALGLCAFWCLLTAYLVVRRRVTWFAIGLASVLSPAAIALLFGTPEGSTAALLAIGLNAMYAFAKIRCAFVGCCNVPRPRLGKPSRLREFQLGRIEALASVALVGCAALQASGSFALAGLPLVAAHGFVRVGADLLRGAPRRPGMRRSLRLLQFVAAMALAQLVLRPSSGLFGGL